jgi:putative membrane protein
MSDREFLQMAAEEDMTAANLGKLAEERAAETGVKDFGKTLVRDHTDDYRRLCALATKIGQPIPKGIDRHDNREIDHLDAYKSKVFDREFLLHETLEHQKLIATFQREAEHSGNPEIKAYASKALPVIEAHLHEAQDLLKPARHSA